MSTFGNHTPKQEILEELEYIQGKYELTDAELIQHASGVTSYLMDKLVVSLESSPKE